MEIKEVLLANNFRFNKSLGQNFITDKNLLGAIVSDAKITSEDTVVEIGTGAGTLTLALAAVCKKVITFEVDVNLRPVLDVTLAKVDNVEVHFADVLKLTDEQLQDIIKVPFKVVANLPYYITTPLIMRFMESTLEFKSLTLMMQKEVALRMVAVEGTSDYGAITAVVALQANCSITRTISKQLFYPQPKVDSALVHIEIVENKYKFDDIKFVKKLIKCAFMWRRKTFANNLCATFPISKERSEFLLKSLNFDANIRGERFSPQDFCKLSQLLKEEFEKTKQ